MASGNLFLVKNQRKLEASTIHVNHSYILIMTKYARSNIEKHTGPSKINTRIVVMIDAQSKNFTVQGKLTFNYLVVQFMNKAFCRVHDSAKWERELDVSPPTHCKSTILGSLSSI